MQTKKVLGIDLGIKSCAYSLVEKKEDSYFVIAYDILNLSQKKKRSEQLLYFYNELKHFSSLYKPDFMAVEKIIYKHFQSSFILNQVYATLLFFSAKKEILLYEYNPLHIKKNITGNGKASKVLVQHILNLIISFKQKPLSKKGIADLYDSVAVAICHLKTPVFDLTKDSLKYV